MACHIKGELTARINIRLIKVLRLVACDLAQLMAFLLPALTWPQKGSM